MRRVFRKCEAALRVIRQRTITRIVAIVVFSDACLAMLTSNVSCAIRGGLCILTVTALRAPR
jgi:hypothetical protein